MSINGFIKRFQKALQIKMIYNFFKNEFFLKQYKNYILCFFPPRNFLLMHLVLGKLPTFDIYFECVCYNNK